MKWCFEKFCKIYNGAPFIAYFFGKTSGLGLHLKYNVSTEEVFQRAGSKNTLCKTFEY